MNVLKRLFKPSRREVWERFCRETGAEYDPGGLLTRPRVRHRHRNWTITLTTSRSSGPAPGTSLTTTRIGAPFVSTSGFRFTLERKAALSKLGKPIGRHFVTSGHGDFDDDFWLKSRDEPKVHALLDDDSLRQAFRSQPGIYLKVKDHAGWFGPKFPESADLLQFEEIGEPIHDVGRLVALFNLVSLTLDRLSQIGAATGDDPGIVL
jgi:hypothetical protein